MRELVDLLKVMADESRLKIIFALEKKPACVCELANFLKLSQATVSSHLKQLRQAGMVDYKKDGKWVEYFLSENENIRNLTVQMKLFIKNKDQFEKEMNNVLTINRECLSK